MDEFCGAVHEMMAEIGRADVALSVVRELTKAGLGLGPGPGVRVIGVVKEAGHGSQDQSCGAPATTG